VAYSYYGLDVEFTSWHIHILEIAFSDAYGVLAPSCGTGAVFEEKLAVLIHSEGKKRLRQGLDLRRAHDAAAIASIAVQHFARTVSWRQIGQPILAAPSHGFGRAAQLYAAHAS
jgi:hypothetical protein